MTDKADTKTEVLPPGTGTFRMALLLFVIAIALTIGNASQAAGLFVVGTLICAVIGGVQRMSARR
jgi:hypothetical protein